MHTAVFREHRLVTDTLTQGRTNRQTDRQTDRVIGNTALAKCHAVNNFNNGVRRHFCHFVSFNLSLV